MTDDRDEPLGPMLSRLMGADAAIPAPDGTWTFPPEPGQDVVRLRAFIPISEELLEDLGYPPPWRGLEYWRRREREEIRWRSLRNRIRRPFIRIRSLAEDTPRRLRNARAALAGDWEADPDR